MDLDDDLPEKPRRWPWMVMGLLLGMGLAGGWHYRGVVMREPAPPPQMTPAAAIPDDFATRIKAALNVPLPEKPLGNGYQLDVISKDEESRLPVKTAPLELENERVVEAVRALQRFQAADSWAEKRPLVFQPSVTEEVMRDYYEVRKGRDPELGALKAAMEFQFGTSKLVQLTLACRERFTGSAQVAFHRTVGGELRLDWKQLVAYSEVAWEDFITKRESQPKLFRVHASPDDYFNYEFADPRKFISLKLRSPDGKQVIHGYLLRGSPLAGILEKFDSITGAPLAAESPLVLRLAFPINAQSNSCCWVERMLGSHWMLLPGQE
jgi:hypothetical protein